MQSGTTPEEAALTPPPHPVQGCRKVLFLGRHSKRASRDPIAVWGTAVFRLRSHPADAARVSPRHRGRLDRFTPPDDTALRQVRMRWAWRIQLELSAQLQDGHPRCEKRRSHYSPRQHEQLPRDSTRPPPRASAKRRSNFGPNGDLLPARPRCECRIDHQITGRVPEIPRALVLRRPAHRPSADHPLILDAARPRRPVDENSSHPKRTSECSALTGCWRGATGHAGHIARSWRSIPEPPSSRRSEPMITGGRTQGEVGLALRISGLRRPSSHRIHDLTQASIQHGLATYQ
jgi:hypothetical protein